MIEAALFTVLACAALFVTGFIAGHTFGDDLWRWWDE